MDTIWKYVWKMNGMIDVSISCDTNDLNISSVDVIIQAYFVAYFYHVFDG